jgi:Holliday junction resolvase
MTPESRVKQAIKRWLDRHGVWHFSPAANGFGKAGVPDLICCYAGSFIAIEVKALGKLSGVTELQKRRIEEIRKAGGIAFAADRVEVVEENLAWLIRSTGNE